MNNIDKALDKVESIVIESGNENDITYFMFHKKRFKRMAERLLPPASREVWF